MRIVNCSNCSSQVIPSDCVTIIACLWAAAHEAMSWPCPVSPADTCCAGHASSLQQYTCHGRAEGPPGSSIHVHQHITLVYTWHLQHQPMLHGSDTACLHYFHIPYQAT